MALDLALPEFAPEAREKSEARPSIQSEEETAVATVRESRSSDISKMTMTLPMAAAIVVTALTVNLGSYLLSSGDREKQAAMASDIRNIATQLEGMKEMRQRDAENLELRLSNMKYEVDNANLKKLLLEELKP